MKTRTQIIFWLMLLLVGLQWIGDPVDTRLTNDQSLAAGWHDSDANGPDNSHHFGVAPPTDFALGASAMRLAVPAISGWLPLTLDVSKLQDPSLLHRIPRAPPAA
ncbi:MAG TPA: hypothetical protein VLM91_17095 [Candidatus Methylomirabilis sp.]|nr:hypothetical protein [Candidatus Methylomirabilis sp.]